MNQSHTPGPWRQSSVDKQDVVCDPCPETRTVVATVYHQSDVLLIAAAPDLLAACIRAIKSADKPEDFIEGSCAYETLKTAIAKATSL